MATGLKALWIRPSHAGGDPFSRTTSCWCWTPRIGLLLKGELPAKSANRHVRPFDSKRDRILRFSDQGPKAGNVAAFDLKTFEARWFDPACRLLRHRPIFQRASHACTPWNCTSCLRFD